MLLEFDFTPRLHEQPKSVRFLLSDRFCQAVRPIFVSIDTPHLHETQNRMHYFE